MSPAWDHVSGGFATPSALDSWFEYIAWCNSPDNDPAYYVWEKPRSVRPGDVLPFIGALADLLVADLLRVGPGRA